MNEITVPMKDQRDISTVTTEIRTLHRQAQKLVLGYAIEIGRRLCEAKELLPHGQWGEWLKTEVEFSQSTAQNFMRIFEEYGADQTSLFGDAKSQTLGNLPYTHALKLLAVPAEEREQFAEEHHVEELSSRELEKLIRERDEALDEAKKWEKKAKAAQEDLDDAEDKLREAEEEIEEKEKELAEARDADEGAALAAAEAVEKLEAEADRLREAAAAAIEDAKKAKAQLKELQENPEVPAEVLEKLGAEAAEKAKADAAAELEQAKAEAEKQAAELKEKAAAAEKELEALRRAVKTADGETAAFKARFTDLQRAFGVLREMHDATMDEEKAAAMQRAMQALIAKEAEAWAAM